MDLHVFYTWCRLKNPHLVFTGPLHTSTMVLMYSEAKTVAGSNFFMELIRSDFAGMFDHLNKVLN